MNNVQTAAAATARPASRLLTSLRMQAIEYRRRVLVLVLVLALPVAFFAATYYTAPTTPSPELLKVPERTGTVEKQVAVRETFPMGVGLMGVAWGVAAAAFFSVVGSLQRDRRLVLAGYSTWQILLARLGILACISVVLAVAATLLYTSVTSVLHPELVWLAAFLAGLIASGVGLTLGALLPRPTEGMLIIIGVYGVGLSMGQDAGRYFILTYPASQLLTMGRLANDPWPVPYVWQNLLVAAVFVALSLTIWWRRTRVAR